MKSIKNNGGFFAKRAGVCKIRSQPAGRNKPVYGRFRQVDYPASAAYFAGNARRAGLIPAYLWHPCVTSEPCECVMNPQQYTELACRIRPAFSAKLREENLPAALEEALCRVYLPLAHWIHGQKLPGKPLLLGVNGAQGSGKSTLCALMRLILTDAYDYRVAGFSIDDIYLGRAERQRLSREIHPLLATRGVPGTHDIALGLHTLQALLDPVGRRVAIPAFDKGLDDRRPQQQWTLFAGPADIVLFEGWCVGATAQPEAELAKPVNDLEREEDPGGIWRTHVNRQLQGPYSKLFALIDRLLMLKVPDMECVYAWRSLQEQKLAANTSLSSSKLHIMDAKGLKRFIMHYERLTRHMLADRKSVV